jgi:hypothetical protein
VRAEGENKKKKRKETKKKKNHDKHPVSRIWPVSEGGVQLALAAVPSFFIFTCRSFSSLFERNKFS